MARRRSRSRTRTRGLLALIVAGGVLAYLAVDWLAAHPAVLITLVVTLVVGGLAAGGLAVAWVAARRRREVALTRSIDAVDALTGPEFERWLATLMRRTGFRQVRVSGGAGDLGADVTALTPDGRLLVVQCKRHQPGRPVGSPAVQKLAGTARAVHGADLAAIITTSRFTRPAAATAAQLGIRLVDRDALARWATDDLQPVALVAAGAPVPPGG